MATPIKTEGSRTSRKVTTDLVCDCGRRLSISVDKKGWLVSMWAVALANRWNLKSYEQAALNPEFPAICPQCRVPAMTHSHD